MSLPVTATPRQGSQLGDPPPPRRRAARSPEPVGGRASSTLAVSFGCQELARSRREVWRTPNRIVKSRACSRSRTSGSRGLRRISPCGRRRGPKPARAGTALPPMGTTGHQARTISSGCHCSRASRPRARPWATSRVTTTWGRQASAPRRLGLVEAAQASGPNGHHGDGAGTVGGVGGGAESRPGRAQLGLGGHVEVGRMVTAGDDRHAPGDGGEGVGERQGCRASGSPHRVHARIALCPKVRQCGQRDGQPPTVGLTERCQWRSRPTRTWAANPRRSSAGRASTAAAGSTHRGSQRRATPCRMPRRTRRAALGSGRHRLGSTLRRACPLDPEAADPSCRRPRSHALRPVIPSTAPPCAT